jgi:protein-S-isoprenylcysteine O-methyltransferase Ste14
MFPVLVAVYLRLARSEEREVAGRLGAEWAAYAARTPGFTPAAVRRSFRILGRSARQAES